VEHVHDSRYLAPAEFKRRREFNKQYKHIRFFKKISDIVIVLTKQNYEFVINNGLSDKAKVREIQNGIPIPDEREIQKENKNGLKQKLNLKKNDAIILTPSRLSPEKNAELVLRIAPIVKKECPNAVFIISGDGPLFEGLKTKCKGLDNTVKMIGFYPRIDKLLQISDVFLLPSFLELHSIAILEAMSMKVPVVISKNVGCNDEFIDDWNNGVLLDPFTDNGWAKAIVKLIRDKELRQLMGEKGYRLCKEQFEIKNIAKKIENIYTGLINE